MGGFLREDPKRDNSSLVPCMLALQADPNKESEEGEILAPTGDSPILRDLILDDTAHPGVGQVGAGEALVFGINRY